MKAVTVTEAGTPESLKTVHLPDPIPTDTEVIIQQTYAGINYGDAIRRKRGLFQLNSHGYYIPGFEGIGRITSLGKAVGSFRIGDRVGYLNDVGEGYAQQVCMDQKYVFPIPNNLSDQTAAALVCVGATAWNLIKLSQLKQNDWAVVHGAAGGVGLILIQLALLKGINVIGIVGTEQKKDFLSRYKGVKVVVKSDYDLSTSILELTGGVKIDAIFDCVGQAVLDTNLSCIKKGGIILYFGSTSGHPSFPGMNVLMNSLRIQGFNIFNVIDDTNSWREGLKELFEIVVVNEIDVYISEIFSMDDVFKAHQLLEGRGSIGKMLLNLQ